MFKSRVNLLGVQYCAKVLSHSHFFIFSFESGKKVQWFRDSTQSVSFCVFFHPGMFLLLWLCVWDHCHDEKWSLSIRQKCINFHHFLKITLPNRNCNNTFLILLLYVLNCMMCDVKWARKRWFYLKHFWKQNKIKTFWIATLPRTASTFMTVNSNT